MKLFWGILLFPLITQAVDFCRKHPELQALQDMQKCIRVTEDAPFTTACKGVNVSDRPKTGLLVRDVPVADAQGNRTRDLLKALHKKLMSILDQQKQKNQKLSSCFSKNLNAQNPKDCEKELAWAKTGLPDLLSEMRYNLALSQSPHAIGLGAKPNFQVNESLWLTGIFKETAWDPLTSDEKEKVNATMESYKNEITKSLTKSALREPTENLILSVRMRHFGDYMSSLANYPFTQYLSSANPSKEEMTKALEKWDQQIENEKKFLNSMESKISGTNTEEQTRAAAFELVTSDGLSNHISAQGSNWLSPDVLQLMLYNSELEEVLLENPQFCGTATSLLQTISNRQIGSALALGLPLLTVSLYIPPLAGTLVGAATGGYFTYESHKDFVRTKERTLSRFTGDKASNNQLNTDYRERQLSMVMPFVLASFAGVARPTGQALQLPRFRPFTK